VRGGLRTLVNPASRMCEVDLDASHKARQRLHDEIRTRDHLLWLLSVTEPGCNSMRITPYEVHELVEAEPASIAELYDIARSGVEVPA
jgi:hypothetical protein